MNRRPTESDTPAWIQIIVLSSVCLIGVGVALGQRAALALLPLVMFGLALSRGRTWAVFGLAALCVTLVGAAASGALPPWMLISAAAAGVGPALAFRWLWRFDRFATLAGFGISAAVGALLTLTTCKMTTPPGSAPVAAKPAPIRTDVSPLYSLFPARPAVRRVCPAPASGQTEASHTHRIVYDFNGERIEPLPFGPLIVQRPLLVTRRGIGSLERAVGKRKLMLRGCYRWARQASRRSLARAAVRIEARVNMWGRVTRLEASTRDTPAAGLSRCVERVLSGMQLGSARPVQTTYAGEITFAPSGQGEPDRALKPPAAPPETPAPPMSCMMVHATKIPRDRITSPAPLVTIDDFDEAQAGRERRRDCARRGVRCPPIPRVHTCGTHVRSSPSKEIIRSNIRHNVGAYRRCYRRALARHPGLRGTVELSGMISPAGLLAHVRVRRATVDVPGLRPCLVQALNQVSFPPFSGDVAILISFPFELVPSAPPSKAIPDRVTAVQLEAVAARQLERGDGAGALRSCSALLRARPRAAAACGWHIDAVRSTMLIAPWIDERVEAAFAGLADHLRRSPDGAWTTQCRDRAARALEPLATAPHRQSRSDPDRAGLDTAVVWYRRILALRPTPVPAHRLRFYLAEALYDLRRYREARIEYQKVSRDRGPRSKEARHAEKLCQVKLSAGR